MKKEVFLVLLVIIITGCTINNPKNTVVQKKYDQEFTKTLDNYPLILVHGHAVNVGEAANFLKEYQETGSFGQLRGFQIKLEEDGMYNNKNVILAFQNVNDVCKIGWEKRSSVRMSYYIDEYGNFDDHSSIETYAGRLAKVVEEVKKCTNSDKVNLIGYSMGGLVARQYLINNENSINKLITIGTPNQGLQENALGPTSLCKEFRYENDFECKEMNIGSEFLSNLNSQTNIINVTMYTISAVLKNRDLYGLLCNDYGGCNDGIVCTKLAQINNAKNYVVYSETPSSKASYVNGIHGNLINPETDAGSKVYDATVNILANKNILPNDKEWDKKCVLNPERNINYLVNQVKNNIKQEIESLFIKINLRYP